eukprot:TRINITY_DN737_c0_g1_i1.p2 TRINITY_DN737_c0_g1~~TRINITY_DN737_c0_g1_i1.p2  ORF type:complete len:893 (-),score=284.60 TRINITY_DN737_c0_g1_i1:6951-9629(-)
MARGELKPPKPGGGRRGSFNPPDKGGGGGGGGDGTFEWSWDKESTPLSARGKEAKFVAKPQEKFSGSEKDNIYVNLEIFGDPVPKVEWYKGFKDLSMEGGRFKAWTDGPSNSAVLGVEHVKQEDEGAYKCIVSNEHGESEHEFNIYVTVEGGMDFRAMLMKRKKPQKKVVEKFEWIEEPVDRNIKQGTCDEVSFSCKLSHKGKKGKWYLRNQECYKGAKYTMTHDEDLYVITIKNPDTNDSGRYSCVIRECNDLTCKAYLEVEPPDPEFSFKKNLDKKKHGQTKRKVKLSCKVDNDGCRVKWYKDGVEVKPSDTRFLIEQEGGDCNLTIREAEISDTGTYTCKIEEFAKEGEGETSCEVSVGEFPHKFTSELKGKNVIEDDQAVFQIDVENDDAEVTWLKDGVPIVPDGKRIQIVKEGKKRKLIINKCKMEDAGNITVQTNADSSSADLGVKYNNGFKKGMREFKQCVERDSIIFNVEVKDPNAPIDFFINGDNVKDIPGARVETKDLGDGKHQLIINKADMKDNGTVTCKIPSNRGDEILESKSAFTVVKGEEAPRIGDVGPVTGVAKKQCNMTIPYQVEGEKQSDLEILVEKDGKLLKIGKDVQLTVHGDRIQLDVINPKREKSGIYKVIMKNAQGSDEALINVNIMDIPTPPTSVYVDTVFQDNMTVHWSPPKDNGGTEIKKYIIEALDTTSGNSHWNIVGQSATGNDRAFKVEHLTPMHKYRFRVRAANKIGQSDPTEMSGDDILAKDPWDEPDPCGRPNVADWGPDFAELNWAPPENDGGAPITHYVIEYKEKNMADWAEGKSLTVDEVEKMGNMIKGKQDGLIEGCEYTFRVRAVNKGGPSKPSPPSNPPMVAKHRFIPPHLKGDGIFDITLKKRSPHPLRSVVWR